MLGHEDSVWWGLLLKWTYLDFTPKIAFKWIWSCLILQFGIVNQIWIHALQTGMPLSMRFDRLHCATVCLT